MLLTQLLSELTDIYPIMGSSFSTSDFVDIDLSVNNDKLVRDPYYDQIDDYVNLVISTNKKELAIGGYMEKRNLYASSEHFNDEEPRNIHLAIDIWAPSRTPIYAPIEGTVVSGTYNANHLDYGYTLILRHEVSGIVFHTLYGHLGEEYSLQWKPGRIYKSGDLIADLGAREENGGWPPHVHFQIIEDMASWYGDYPGVCRDSEKAKFLLNCPNPMLLIQKGVH